VAGRGRGGRLTFGHAAEDGVLAIQVGRRDRRDEELRADRGADPK